MSNEEAKFLLQAYRPDGRDAQDPQFAEALDQVQKDPALAEWFRYQQAFDRVMSGRLQAVPVPTALKRDILAGRATLDPRAWWTRRSMVTALAACFLVCLGVVAALLTSTRQPNLARYRADMVQFVNDLEAGQETLRFVSSDWSAIEDWLKDQRKLGSVHLPASLSAESGLGCRLVDWQGGSVALVCFRLNETGAVAHLFVLDQGSLRKAPDPEEGRWVAVAGMNTRAWSDRGRIFLVVSRARREILDHLL